MEQNYLMINDSTNVVDNICIWDGNPNTWQPPSNYLMLVQATTPAYVWVLNSDKTAYVLGEITGAGQIGFTWDGTAVTTNEPQPAPPQVETTGTQNA
jgi:hypothetical protein